MSISNEKQLITIVQSDPWMMNILEIVSNLGLHDCWIGAGFVRNKVWDHLHQLQRTNLNDIDIIHYNSKDTSKTVDLEIENLLKKQYPENNWSVKNQARMHLKHGHAPYKNNIEALSHWPETATAIAIRWHNQQIELIAPYGLNDLFQLKVKPTPNFDQKVVIDRVQSKNWLQNWNLLRMDTDTPQE